MSPRYEEGDPAYVDPKRQPRVGDYVVVQLREETEEGDERLRSALLKRLVRRTSTLVELCQLNPPMTFTVPAKDIYAIHRVIPWREIVFF